MPAAPHMPKPGPALPAFSRISVFASSSSCRTSVVVSFASCLSSSPIGRSRSSSVVGLPGVDTGAASLELQPAILAVLLVAPRAGRLHEARRDEPEHGSAAGDEPRLTPCELLDVTQEAVTVVGDEVLPEPLRSRGDALEHLRLRLLLVAAQLLRRLAQGGGCVGHLLARLRRTRLDLLAETLACLLLGLDSLLLNLLRAFADALFHLLAHADPFHSWMTYKRRGNAAMWSDMDQTPLLEMSP